MCTLIMNSCLVLGSPEVELQSSAAGLPFFGRAMKAKHWFYGVDPFVVLCFCCFERGVFIFCGFE